MFKSLNRFVSRKLLRNGSYGKAISLLQHPQGTYCDEAVCQYLSYASLSTGVGHYERCFPPLFHPLKGIKLPPFLPDVVERYPTKITTLPNGLRIASEDAPGPAAAIGLYVDCGSVYETVENAGVTHLLERMAYKSTRNRNHAHIVRSIEATGGNAGASASREQMAYLYDTLKAHIPAAVELLVDCVRNPVFLDCEVEEQLKHIRSEIGEIASKDPQQFLLESLHVAGYSGALGNPMVASEAALERIDGSVIRKFYSENFNADRIVLAAFGVDHEQLLTVGEPLLYDWNAEPSVDQTHVALAFEAPGGWHHDKNATALTVLQTLMGGGGSFSAGGPGKGMHSRLYIRVLNKHQEVHSFSAFSSIFNDTGLFGIALSTGSDFLANAVNIAASELLAIATPGQVTELELDRAKNATKSAILMNLESRAIVAEDIGRQILTFGTRKPVEYFLQCVDELTIDDLTILAQKILSSPSLWLAWEMLITEQMSLEFKEFCEAFLKSGCATHGKSFSYFN
ncbi:hypothetical protein HPP92_023076 [Vanilla planifolia]|uniref:Mitochondrial-processing peptidase subunit alpha n=1 Tax=Vanilla planifolia TaxID=51239 RepID=A0A835PUK6_VANPL|nr:hypothetical protein HPP92_023076 [Vanilla planifolia]